MKNNNCHFQVGSLVTANLSWQLALPISIGANFGHNPYSWKMLNACDQQQANAFLGCCKNKKCECGFETELRQIA